MNIKQLTKYIDNEIKKILESTNGQNLYEPISYILNVKGKRIRPILTLLSYSLFNENYQKAISAALAIEIFHNFTLMHDDIMDKSPIRRNQPTAQKKWGINRAVLSGDTMLIKSYQLLSLTPITYLSRLIKRFNECGLAICQGQQLDMDFEKTENVTQKKYLEMIKLKTGILYGFCMEAGAIIGGTNEKMIALLKDFGICIGMAFQLKDDILDIYGDKEKFGKQIGGDIIANKKTFLLIKALEKAQNDQKILLKNWLTKKTFDKTEKITNIIMIFNELDIKKETEKKMNEYFRKSFSILKKLQIPEEKKFYLANFTKNLIHREN